MSTFTFSGADAATCVRGDKSLVITQDSDNMGLRVEDDDQFLDLMEQAQSSQPGR